MSAAARGCCAASISGEAPRSGIETVLGRDRVREGRGCREGRMRRDEGQVGAERRRPGDRQPGQEPVGQEGRLAVLRGEDGGRAEPAPSEDAVAARVGIVDPEALAP